MLVAALPSPAIAAEQVLVWLVIFALSLPWLWQPNRPISNRAIWQHICKMEVVEVHAIVWEKLDRLSRLRT